ncbi:MerR family transcriptional regulator [Psychroserpens sp.]|uniref:MerR family transcriptional regulator n=1 Tax=Psychroserpens sp. TaxID=2020870 RepID=UPI001B06B26D|nr:MerR family transcriptional regulator [Psychroserpens sp.]MBO6607238.1 MerR family transcriptional regulator [Psychroserpens sp.]MBO6654384.1 MerR family transcriptional regulator [Psychroserpens sp.]MBO6682330.1 MerR family transcriptional regulator [Psychroserpens sp.]MBO6751010.1 MerR family transcriptional regulator [Psychroserpens sp.]MBO6915561.1 MerR family transcriptional regulator [Psychroserpens sp.]
MNNVKSTFSIKDLENLTGIKAHTIRIWEKRYNLLQPERTDTNIRYYSLSNLQKLLNISYLNSNGYKISKIAGLDNDGIRALVKDVAQNDATNNHALDAFKLSMLNFDQKLFYDTYNGLLKEKSFTEMFYEDLIPLLSEIGLLWQTDTITPAHEHFLTSLIRQKILINTEKIQAENQVTTDKIFVLYLPDNEVHELGLMLINYEIIARGHQSIFLGQSVPLNSLRDILGYYDDITFVSYFTVKPEKDQLEDYIKDFTEEILIKDSARLWVLGRMLEEIDLNSLPDRIIPFDTIKNLVKKL